MPAAKKIYISATTKGLWRLRGIVRDIVDSQGYAAVVQENFSMPRDEIVGEIHEKVFACQGLIALAGPFYGSCASLKDPAGYALSYTQYEVEYALHHKRPCVALITGDSFVPDANRDGSIPEEDAADQKLQKDFIQRLKKPSRGVGRSTFNNDFEMVFALAKHRWSEWLGGGHG